MAFALKSTFRASVVTAGEVSFSGVVDVGLWLVEGGSLLLQSMSLKFLARR